MGMSTFYCQLHAAAACAGVINTEGTFLSQERAIVMSFGIKCSLILMTYWHLSGEMSFCLFFMIMYTSRNVFIFYVAKLSLT